ncbi:glycosyltransferase [Pontibacter sp. G13]|uniref:glycosyltransferase n=1 Tax=Pontibacter sp. G13 TaxID=3074898 RepID=UPI00288C31AD|nr:glycosyltransferase [Pontibacter sp. G13]WNJ19593.1 glycosyltransferase [Pontibacter sp. G13]
MIWIALAFSLAYLCFQALLTIGILRLKSVPTTKQKAPISVVIAAKNEAANLWRCLESVRNQEYGDFEVILVLDRCEDHSLEIAEEFQLTFPQLRIIEVHNVPEDWSPKKYALQMGIEAARYDLLAFTDADCVLEPQVLAHVNRQSQDGNEVILGLGWYERRSGWLNRFIQFETYYVAFQYIGAAALGMAYMGVGRNLAYRRKAYERVGGMEAIREHLSGDDDLLVNQAAQAGRVGTMIAPGSRSWSIPKESFAGWVRQKNRHVSASHQYSLSSKTLLGAFHGSHIGMYVATILTCWQIETSLAGFSLYIIRLLLSWWMVRKTGSKLGSPTLGAAFPILDLLFFLYNLSIVPFGLINQPAWTK